MSHGDIRDQTNAPHEPQVRRTGGAVGGAGGAAAPSGRRRRIQTTDAILMQVRDSHVAGKYLGGKLSQVADLTKMRADQYIYTAARYRIYMALT